MNESCLSISGTKDTETKKSQEKKKKRKNGRWGLGPRPHCLYQAQLPHGKKGGESMVQKNGDRQRKTKRRGTIN